MIPTVETSEDWFLTDRLLVQQPKKGFRAGGDSLLLSAAVPALAGESVLELGSGVGVVSLALASRVAGLGLHLVEIDGDTAALARHNIAVNHQAGRLDVSQASVLTGDAHSTDLFVQGTFFDHCYCNPPYFDPRATRHSDHHLADLARRTSTPLSAWVKAMVRWTKSGGTMTMICRAHSSVEVLSAFERSAGGIELIPLYPKPDEPAVNVIIRGVKGSRAAFRLRQGLTIRDGGGKLAPEVEQIQRFGNFVI